MDCANDTAQRVHRVMVYVIMGDIVLLSQTALKDLGVIPKTFPTIGEFGGEEQQGDGHDRFEVDANLPTCQLEVHCYWIKPAEW